MLQYVLQIESKQCGEDDTSVNGVRLICGSKAGTPDGSYASSSIGQRGDWKGEVRCLPGQVIVAFRLQVQSSQVNHNGFRCYNIFGVCSLF